LKFEIKANTIPEVLSIVHEEFEDKRGVFAELYRECRFADLGLPHFVQDNYSSSFRDVLRGLHYQLKPAAVGKLVYCIKGAIWDVAVDIRKGSPTYGKYVAIELAEKNRTMLYVPTGFAHGFVTLSEIAIVLYKMTNYYSPLHDRCIRWSDPAIGIDWPIKMPIVSVKDADAPSLADAENDFT
jgi:dTDP-4-dehydrorhamnose 3,5-epimerase